MVWPITRTEVVAYLGVGPTDPADMAQMDLAAAAAVEWIQDNIAPPADGDWSTIGPRVELAARMLAGRWYNRRSSVMGIAAFGEMGVSMIVRSDPDVARLLGLGKPAVG